MCWTEMTPRAKPIGLVQSAGSDGVRLTENTSSLDFLSPKASLRLSINCWPPPRHFLSDYMHDLISLDSSMA
jgi:hypothetical protein